MSAALATLAVAALPAFVASIVEWVEAFTIVLAVANTRGWRSPIWGTAAGLGTLALTIGRQIGEALELHKGMDRSRSRKRTIELLELVGIPAAKIRLDD